MTPSDAKLVSPTYRGSPKHKNRPAEGLKGTLCPEWTHRTPDSGLGNDAFDHDWGATPAARLFADAVVDPATGRRYATANGVAFEARQTFDGTWHGFPVPWAAVPDQITAVWIRLKAVTRRQRKAFMSFDKSEIHWALKTDI